MRTSMAGLTKRLCTLCCYIHTNARRAMSSSHHLYLSICRLNGTPPGGFGALVYCWLPFPPLRAKKKRWM